MYNVGAALDRRKHPKCRPLIHQSIQMLLKQFSGVPLAAVKRMLWVVII